MTMRAPRAGLVTIVERSPTVLWAQVPYSLGSGLRDVRRTTAWAQWSGLEWQCRACNWVRGRVEIAASREGADVLLRAMAVGGLR
jgi:hypothetical protein